MELRVWVDGTQRVVCGVKLTTTCQEIVFALAHATQQAGRFTMIERWRNNERLLSPNEQPLVTLQRWGDHMNEVEFILKKTSSDLPNNSAINQLQPQQRPVQQVPTRPSNQHELEPSQQAVSSNGRIESGSSNSNMTNSVINQAQHLNDQSSSSSSFDNIYQHHQYNLNRRPQTVLGPLTSTSSSGRLDSNFLQHSQPTLSRLPNPFRASISTSTLPNASNSMSASPSAAMMRPHYIDDQLIQTSTSAMMRHSSNNGYPLHSESQLHQKITNLHHQQQQQQNDQSQASKNYPFEDLYSTINKKRNNQPPAVPAKPRVVAPVNPATNINMSHQQPVNSGQMNFYHPNPSPLNMYPGNLRPRHPPGYLDYMEAMANRNSLPQPLLPNPNYAQSSQQTLGNTYQRSYDPQHMYNIQQNSSSPVSNVNSTGNRTAYRYSINGHIGRTNYEQSLDSGVSPNLNNVNAIRSKLIDSSPAMNRGSVMNLRLPPNSQHNTSSASLASYDRLETSAESSASVSQMGHDMLKVIEEQKKVLMNQKNELDRLDTDQEFRENKQSSEQAELINRIETEIRQLEDLWKENQTQIKKLENQNFDKELEDLKAEQVEMELELTKQKSKLSRCEKDFEACQSKIEKLEAELANFEPNGGQETVSSSSDEERGELQESVSKSGQSDELPDKSDGDKTTDDSSTQLSLHTNGLSTFNGDESTKEIKSSEEEEEDSEDSGGDVSDDLNLPTSENKLRSAKDAAYVDKRGLISGIRSLKLDKSRLTMNRQMETLRGSTENIDSTSTASNSKEKPANNSNGVDKRCQETNGQFSDKTANNNNKYEFLMTL